MSPDINMASSLIALLPVSCLEVYHGESLHEDSEKGNINGIKERLRSSSVAVGGGILNIDLSHCNDQAEEWV